MNGADVIWDGSNQVGQFSDEAQSVIDKLSCEEELLTESFEYAVSLISNSADLGEYLSDAAFPSESQSVSEFAGEIIDDISYEYYGLCDNLSTPEGLLTALSDVWANFLYNGDELPQEVAKYLIEEGVCDDSAWMDELNAMAEGTYNKEDF